MKIRKLLFIAKTISKLINRHFYNNIILIIFLILLIHYFYNYLCFIDLFYYYIK